PRPFRVPGYPVTPLLFVLSGFAIVVNTVIDNPRQGAIGLGATALALPIFFLWRRLAPPPNA
ncbi:MAG: amino acid permease, partial [Gemmatimonadetes bacterium]|nr:amino acid permease [Gemmatimonadota bacterium]